MGLGSAQMPRYFSAKPPALVTRFGTGTYLGAVVVIEGGMPSIKWEPDRIVEISDAELTAYLRDYATLVRDGALIEHEEAAYRAYCEYADEEAELAAAALEESLDQVDAALAAGPQTKTE